MTELNICNEVLENAIGVHKNCEKCGLEISPIDAVAVQAMEELLQYRAIGTVEECREAVRNRKEARNKAIDDFAKWLENKKYLIKEIQDNYLCYTHYDELKADYVITEYLAEQLKGGVEE